MEEAFPNTPIIPCLGNHDSFPAVSYGRRRRTELYGVRGEGVIVIPWLRWGGEVVLLQKEMAGIIPFL